MRITDILAGLEKDPQVADVQRKLASEAEKKAVAGPADPEQEIDAQMGDTEMDSRAKLHAKALLAAGKQREMQTWKDKDEALNSRNPGTAPAPAGPSNIDNARHVRPTGQSLPGVGKAASETVKRASLAEWATYMEQENGEKVAAEKMSALDLKDVSVQIDTARFMGACNAIGEMRALLSK